MVGFGVGGSARFALLYSRTGLLLAAPSSCAGPLLQRLPAVGFRLPPPLLSVPLLRCSFPPPEPLVSFAPSQTMPCARRGTGDAPGLAGEREAREREGERRRRMSSGEGGEVSCIPGCSGRE